MIVFLGLWAWGCASSAPIPQQKPPEPASTDWQELFHEMDEPAGEIEIAVLQTEIAAACPSNWSGLSEGARGVRFTKECCNPALLKHEIKALERLRGAIATSDPDHLKVLERLVGVWFYVERIERMYCGEIKIPKRISRGDLAKRRERFEEHRRWIRRSRKEVSSICLDLYSLSPEEAQDTCGSSLPIQEAVP